MTVKELLLKTNFNDLFEILKNELNIFSNVQKEDSEKMNLYCENYYKKAINSLCNIDAKNKEENNLIVVLKQIDEFSPINNDKEVFSAFKCDKNDLNNLTADNIDDFDLYDLSYSEWEDIAFADVSERSIDIYGENIVAAVILHTITFFGCDCKTVKNALDEYFESNEKLLGNILSGDISFYNEDELEKKFNMECLSEYEECKFEYENLKRIVNENKMRTINMLL